MAVHGSVV